MTLDHTCRYSCQRWATMSRHSGRGCTRRAGGGATVVPVEDFDAHGGGADGGQVALVDDEDVAVQYVGKQLRHLGFEAESATDVEGSLLFADARFDDHPVGEQHPFDDAAGGRGAAGSGMAPSNAVRGSANQSGPRSGRVWGMNTGASAICSGSALECGADQSFYRDVALAVAEPCGTLGERIAAVDDTVDQPPAGADVDALQRAGAWSGAARALDTTCVVPMMSSGRPPGSVPSA